MNFLGNFYLLSPAAPRPRSASQGASHEIRSQGPNKRSSTVLASVSVNKGINCPQNKPTKIGVMRSLSLTNLKLNDSPRVHVLDSYVIIEDYAPGTSLESVDLIGSPGKKRSPNIGEKYHQYSQRARR